MANVYRYINHSDTVTVTTQNYTILPRKEVRSATTIPELDRLDNTMLSKIFNGKERNDPAEYNYYQPVVSHAKGDGIKLNIENPQYPWHDLLSPTTPYTGPAAHAPVFEELVTSIRKYQFKLNDESFHEFHIPHDYAPGTDLYIHTHWTHNSGSVTGGSVTWEYAVTYAKGYNQQAFTPTKYLPVTQTVVTTPLTHQIAEVKLSVAGGSATQLNSEEIETDGLILVRAKLTANSIGVNPFMMFTDAHYQSTNLGTKNKNADFWQ